ncbi:hypothetical protein [Rothia sp. HMSC08A08]|nr:hypothetical protein [Rothia sp. HMSC08A08]
MSTTDFTPGEGLHGGYGGASGGINLWGGQHVLRVRSRNNTGVE